jgi:hypothetical protein
MLSPDDRPAPPDLPRFRDDMEKALVAAARATSRPRPARTVTPRRAAAGLAVAAVAVAAVVGIDSALGNGYPAGSGHPTDPVYLGPGAFSLASSGGTVTVTLRSDDRPDPSALRKALAKAGVPALVTVGSVCYVPGPTLLNQVLGPPQNEPGGTTVLIIHPAGMPAGQELSIGYFKVPQGGGIHVTLVPIHGHLTCTPGPPAPPG